MRKRSRCHIAQASSTDPQKDDQERPSSDSEQTEGNTSCKSHAHTAASRPADDNSHQASSSRRGGLLLAATPHCKHATSCFRASTASRSLPSLGDRSAAPRPLPTTRGSSEASRRARERRREDAVPPRVEDDRIVDLSENIDIGMPESPLALPTHRKRAQVRQERCVR